MKSFLMRFATIVLGVLGGYDRIRFRGSKRQLCYPDGIMSHLSHLSVLLKDFNKPFAKNLTNDLCASIEEPAKKEGIFRYLNSSEINKEETALRIAHEQGKTEGLIAVLGCIEPCQNARVRKNRQTKLLEIRSEQGKCLHYYHYYLDPKFGLRYTRLQSWFPFTMHMGLNGRDWLERQLINAGLQFVKKDNCFTRIEDFEKAQQLMNQQLETAWQPLLDGWALESVPFLGEMAQRDIPYYWSVQEAEYATDLVFASEADLQRWYPTFVQHAYATLSGHDLLSYMNYRVRPNGEPLALGEVKTTVKELVEGTCVRHRILRNLLKMYDKMSSVLRIESMLLDLEHFKVFRPKEGDEKGELSYRRLRKGVADLHRRAEVSEKINERYVSSLATVANPETLAEATADLGKRTSFKGRTVRALNPIAAEDASLLEAVSQGKFLVSGFSNKDIRTILYPDASSDAKEQKRLAAKVTRMLRMLRGHGVIVKERGANRYKLTEAGRKNLSVILAARKAKTEQLILAA